MDTKSQGDDMASVLRMNNGFCGLKLFARENSRVGRSEAEIDLICD